MTADNVDLCIDFQRVQSRKNELFPNLTDSQFAVLLGVKPQTYSDYKSAKAARPGLDVALKLSIALDLDLRDIVSNQKQVAVFFRKNLR